MKLLKELNIKSDECLIIKDSLSGIQAAKNAIIDVLNIPDYKKKHISWKI